MQNYDIVKQSQLMLLLSFKLLNVKYMILLMRIINECFGNFRNMSNQFNCIKFNILEICYLGCVKKKKVWQYKSILLYNKLYEVNNVFYRGLSKDNGKNINCLGWNCVKFQRIDLMDGVLIVVVVLFCSKKGLYVIVFCIQGR